MRKGNNGRGKNWGVNRKKEKQDGAELGQGQVTLEVIVKVGVEDRCIYIILREF